MRAFIAIDLPEEIKQKLREYQKQLRGGRFSLTKDFHLTLKFLGDIDFEKSEEIKKRLQAVKFSPFSANISSIGYFPNISNIRVIWVGIEPDIEAKMLQKEVDDSLNGLFEIEKDYKSHITLARVKFINNKNELKDSISNIKTEKMKFKVENFKLKKSTLTREGPVYEDLEKPF